MKIASASMILLFVLLMIVVSTLPSVADSKIVSIDQGTDSTFVIKDDGSVWSCGSNNGGRLGDGTTVYKCVLAPTLIDNAHKVAAGNSGMALKIDGTVWTWGSNTNGLRGYRTTDNLTPGAVPNMTDVKDISSSNENNFVIKNDGTVWAWGTNYDGQLGDGTKELRLTPAQIQGLPADIITISPGSTYTLALNASGRVWAWGSNYYGQLGDGTTANIYAPEQVQIDHVIAIAAGGTTSYALKDDGTVWAWGDNQYGEIGDGTTSNRNTPVKVSGISSVIAIAPGTGSVMALKSDGSVWGWGLGGLMFGDGKDYDLSETFHTPKRINITDAAAIYNKNSDYIVMKNDGSLWAWGANYRGELGIGLFGCIVADNDDTSNIFDGKVYTPTKMLTEPGATPLPTVTPTQRLTVTPTITITPVPVNNSSILANLSVNMSASVSSGQTTITMTITPSPAASITPDSTISVSPYSTTSASDTGIPYIGAMVVIGVLVLAIGAGFLVYIKIIKK